MKQSLLCLSLLLTFTFSVSAAQTGIDVHDSNDITYLGNGITEPPTIQPFFEPRCGRFATHDMRSHGYGDAFVGTYPNMNNWAIRNGAQWQCIRCHITMVTTGDSIPNGEAIGTYAVAAASGKNTIFVKIWVSKTYYTSSSKLSGYTFRWS